MWTNRQPIYMIVPFLTLLLLCGCAQNAKSEKEICADLQASEEYISPSATIDDCEIIKRQTDEENKSDAVYLTVHSSGEDLDCTLSYVMRYELYNDGWVLESVGRYYDGPWEFSGIEEKRLVSDIASYDYYFENWDMAVQNVEIIDNGYNSNASTLYEKTFTIKLTALASSPSFSYDASYNLFYEIADGSWTLQNVDVIARSTSPLHSPDVSVSDAIVASLEMEPYHHSSNDGKISYDSFAFSHADIDWENCQETHCYSAKKTWFYGTETFQIAIPYYFSNESGYVRWNYDADAITQTLEHIDWDIEGEWSYSYKGDRAYLRIDDVTATSDPSTFLVHISCDCVLYPGELYEWNCWADTDDPVSLTYNNGHWVIKVAQPDDYSGQWNGQFEFYGYDWFDGSYQHHSPGVYWCERRLQHS